MPPVEESFKPAAHHWVIAGASSLSEPCQQVLSLLDGTTASPLELPALPNLRALLDRLDVQARMEGDEYGLSMPHERLLAQAWGWPHADGHIPWAAWWARYDGVELDEACAWALLSPGHWLMGRDHLTVVDPGALALSNEDSQTLMATVQPYFEEDGWTLCWGAADRWYASHPSLTDYPCASLDRVVGRNPDVWLTDHPQARGVRRLQSEVQMLLYQHPVNDAREAQGLLSINSFWLSGAGRLPANWRRTPSTPRLHDTLKGPLLGDDMRAWLNAWAELDRTVLAEALALAQSAHQVSVTLCGERHAVTLGNAGRQGWWPRWRAAAQRALPSALRRPQAVGAWLAAL